MSTTDHQPDRSTQKPSTVAKVKHLPANGGRAFALLGHTLSFKAESEETDDALFLFEHRMPPTHSVPPHTEHNHEAFYVLEGTLEVEADGERYGLGPHKESLALSNKLGAHKQLTLTLLEGLACTATAEGATQRAARLFGAAQALREATGFPLEPARCALEEPYLVGAHSPLRRGFRLRFDDARHLAHHPSVGRTFAGRTCVAGRPRQC